MTIKTTKVETFQLPEEPKRLKLDKAELMRMLKTALSEMGLLEAKPRQAKMTKLLDNKPSKAQLTRALIRRLFGNKLPKAKELNLLKAKAKKLAAKISELINRIRHEQIS